MAEKWTLTPYLEEESQAKECLVTRVLSLYFVLPGCRTCPAPLLVIRLSFDE
jgi:hypothetical protein